MYLLKKTKGNLSSFVLCILDMYKEKPLCIVKKARQAWKQMPSSCSTRRPYGVDLSTRKGERRTKRQFWPKAGKLVRTFPPVAPEWNFWTKFKVGCLKPDEVRVVSQLRFLRTILLMVIITMTIPDIGHFSPHTQFYKKPHKLYIRHSGWWWWQN